VLLAVLVDLLRVDADVEVGRIDRHPGVLVRVGHALVRGLERVGEGSHQRVDRDALLGGQRLERLHHVGVAHVLRSLSWLSERPCRRRAGPRRPLSGAGPHWNTVRARSMSAYARRCSTGAPSPDDPTTTTPVSSAVVSTPSTRRWSATPATVRIFTVSPMARRKCSGVRSRRSTPGLVT